MASDYRVTVTDRRKVWEVRNRMWKACRDLPALHIERWIVPKRWRRMGTKIHFDDIRNERI